MRIVTQKQRMNLIGLILPGEMFTARLIVFLPYQKLIPAAVLPSAVNLPAAACATVGISLLIQHLQARKSVS